LARVIAT